MVEVTFVGWCVQDSGHRRDVEAEQATTNDGDGRNEVDVPRKRHDGQVLRCRSQIY